MDSTQWRVEVLMWWENPLDNVIKLVPKGKSMVAYSETAQIPWGIDYLRASVWYSPDSTPEWAIQVNETSLDVSEYSPDQLCRCLLRWSGWGNHMRYQLAKKRYAQLSESNWNMKKYLERKILSTNWYMAQWELYTVDGNISDSIYQESARISIILATKLGISVQSTDAQKLLVQSIVPVYSTNKELQEAA
jgi:hypothetical protein